MSTAYIVVVGDELLNGEIQDQNGPWLIQELSTRGVTVRGMSILPDEPDLVADCIRRNLHLDHVLVTGGIGPTHDDRTREAVARALDRPREIHPEVMGWLNANHGDEVEQNDAIREMANLPEGSEAICLDDQPASAFRVENVFIFPGIPPFLKALFLKWDGHFHGADQHTRTLVFQAREVDIAGTLESLQNEFPELQFGCYPRENGRLIVKIRGTRAEKLDQARDQLRESFGDVEQPA